MQWMRVPFRNRVSVSTQVTNRTTASSGQGMGRECSRPPKPQISGAFSSKNWVLCYDGVGSSCYRGGSGGSGGSSSRGSSSSRSRTMVLHGTGTGTGTITGTATEAGTITPARFPVSHSLYPSLARHAYAVR